MENAQELRREFQIILDNKTINLLRIINSDITIVLVIWRSENNLLFKLFWDVVHSAEILFYLKINVDIQPILTLNKAIVTFRVTTCIQDGEPGFRRQRHLRKGFFCNDSSTYEQT